MKLLFIGDLHEKEKAPFSRVDDWQSTLDTKATEILKIAKENNVKAILQPGDFLDTPKISEEYLQKILKRWHYTKPNEIQFNESTFKGCPFIGVVGNHEMFGNSIKNFNKTSLSVLEEVGFMRLVDRKPLLLTENGKTIAITGTGYYPGIDTDINGYIVNEKIGDVHIHLVHGYGTFKDLGPLIPHCNLTDHASKTKADITIIGHDHLGFGLKDLGSKVYVNPGAVTRLSASLDEIERQPMVGLIDIDEAYERGFDVKLIPLNSAKTGDCVLSREHINKKKEKEEFIKRIADQVEQIKLNSHTTIKDIVDEIAQASKIDIDVKNELLGRFNEKMQTITTVSACKDYSIKSLHLENFQSHKDTHLTFGKTNVFTGASGSGKTAILRAFSWIYEDKFKNARRFIYMNEPYAAATIELDTGLKITRKIERKKSGFNGYIIEYPDGTTETLNTKGLPLVQNLLGFNYLSVSDDKNQQGINLNFLKQGEGWFFIGPEVTGPDRSRIVGAIYKTHIADAVQKEINLGIKRSTALLKDKEEEAEKVDLEINSMTHVEKMKTCINEAQQLIEKLEILKEKETKIKSLIDKQNVIKDKMARVDAVLKEFHNIEEAKEILFYERHKLFVLSKLEQANGYRAKINCVDNAINQLSTVTHATSLIEQVKEKTERLNKIQNLSEERQRLIKTAIVAKKSIQKLQRFITDAPSVEEIKFKLQRLEQLNLKYSALQTVCEKKEKASRVIIALDSRTDALQGLLRSLKAKIDVYNNVNAHFNTLSKYKKEEAEMNNTIVSQTKILKDLKKEYWAKLNQLSICPTCMQHISDDARVNMARVRTTK